jgi:DNA-directed RNA polymerase subunit omega
MKATQTESLIEPSIDNLLKKVENKYILSLLIAKRARELFDGEEPLIDTPYINKVTTAIHEVDQGKIRYQRLEKHT